MLHAMNQELHTFLFGLIGILVHYLLLMVCTKCIGQLINVQVKFPHAGGELMDEDTLFDTSAEQDTGKFSIRQASEIPVAPRHVCHFM